MEKRLSLKEINIARHEQEIWNSQLKRGLIDPTQFVRTHYVVCGCGAEGCGFIAQWTKDWHIDLEEQQQLYQRWLEEHQNFA
jgi:hypothetical protein